MEVLNNSCIYQDERKHVNNVNNCEYKSDKCEITCKNTIETYDKRISILNEFL